MLRPVVIMMVAVLGVVPNLAAARLSGEEMLAILNIRAINSAEVRYFAEYGRYATSLSQLGPPSNGKAGPSAADLIPADLASGAKRGYTFKLNAGPTAYTLNANPVKYGVTGSKTFFSDESMVIRVHSGPEPATAASEELK